MNESKDQPSYAVEAVKLNERSVEKKSHDRESNPERERNAKVYVAGRAIKPRHP